MSVRDLLGMTAGNLWRMKLRSFLTVSGVVIAIGAFVAMLSFGAGNRRLVTRQFEELGLLSALMVYPGDADSTPDSIAPARLDDEAVRAFAELPGVRLVYPFDSFSVSVAVGDTTVSAEAQALPQAATRMKLFSRIQAGSIFSDGDEPELLVTDDFLETIGVEEPESLVGRSLVLSVQVASADSGFAHLLRPLERGLDKLLETVQLDSLADERYRRQLLHRELGEGLSRFLAGYTAGRTITDTLTVSGVIKGKPRGRVRIKPLLLPHSVAGRFRSGGPATDPVSLLAAARSGDLFGGGEVGEGSGYPHVTLDCDPFASQTALRDTLSALGYRSFSWTEEFKEIRRAFLLFNLGLAAVGLVALVTAALGIVNTMLMSITERRREIGVLKSLGADLPQVQLIFLVESGMIGAVGAALGILVGWLVARLASVVAKTIMVREGMGSFDLFATPLWLVLTAFFFGVGVSVLAGSLLAARAARVDPVAALRHD